VRPRDHLGPVFLGPIGGFPHQVGELREAQRQFFLVLDHARRLLEDRRDCDSVHVRQVFFADEAGDEPRHLHCGFRLAIGLKVEVCLDLEDLGEVLVVGEQELVPDRIAEQDHLAVERDGLRLQRLGGEQPVALRQILDADLAVTDGALETLVHVRVAEHVLDVEDQVAAVGLGERAGADHREVGQQGAELRPPLDAPDQVGERRVGLDDDRRSLGVRVVDDDVDLVAGEVRLLPGQPQPRNRHRLLFAIAEVLDVVDDVLLYSLQVLADLLVVRVALLEVVHERAQDVHRDLLVEVAELLLHGVLDDLDLGHDVANLFFEFFHLLVEDAASGLFQGLVFFLGERLAVVDGDGPETHRRALELETALPGDALERLEELRLALLMTLRGATALLLVFLALERLGDLLLEVVDELDHRVTQLVPFAGGQKQSARRIGVLEIVDVEEVVRNRFVGRQLGQEPAHDAALAGSRAPGNEDVVSGTGDIETEADGANGALLADDLLEGTDLGGGLERKLLGIAAFAQLLGRQLVGGCGHVRGLRVSRRSG